MLLLIALFTAEDAENSFNSLRPLCVLCGELHLKLHQHPICARFLTSSKTKAGEYYPLSHLDFIHVGCPFVLALDRLITVLNKVALSRVTLAVLISSSV